MQQWADIVFLDGDDYIEAESAVDSGAYTWLEYMQQWDYGDIGEVRDSSPAGTRDDVWQEDGYEISLNRSIGYAGLCRLI